MAMGRGYGSEGECFEGGAGMTSSGVDAAYVLVVALCPDVGDSPRFLFSAGGSGNFKT